MSCRDSKHGFALLQILITVGIVVILTALLYPAVLGAAAKARSAACVNNLRQIGMANQMHMQEYGRVMAGDSPYPRWRRTIREYLMPDDPDRNAKILKTLICPSDPLRGNNRAGTQPPLDTLSYAINYTLRDIPDPPTDGKRGKSVWDPTINPHSKVVYAGDTIVNDPSLTNWITGHSASTLAQRLPRDWHKGLVNFVFLDGHVESFPYESLFPGGLNNHVLRERTTQ